MFQDNALSACIPVEQAGRMRYEVCCTERIRQAPKNLQKYSHMTGSLHSLFRDSQFGKATYSSWPSSPRLSPLAGQAPSRCFRYLVRILEILWHVVCLLKQCIFWCITTQFNVSYGVRPEFNVLQRIAIGAEVLIVEAFSINKQTNKQTDINSNRKY